MVQGDVSSRNVWMRANVVPLPTVQEREQLHRGGQSPQRQEQPENPGPGAVRDVPILQPNIQQANDLLRARIQASAKDSFDGWTFVGKERKPKKGKKGKKSAGKPEAVMDLRKPKSVRGRRDESSYRQVAYRPSKANRGKRVWRQSHRSSLQPKNKVSAANRAALEQLLYRLDFPSLPTLPQHAGSDLLAFAQPKASGRVSATCAIGAGRFGDLSQDYDHCLRKPVDVVERKQGLLLEERVVLSAYAAANIQAKEAKNTRFWQLAQLSRYSEDAAKQMKTEAGEHRSKWILGNGTRLDAQLSFIGRALPEAPKQALSDSLDQHRVDLSSQPKPVCQILLNRLQAFTRKWARRHVRQYKGELSELSFPTRSACYERSQAKGGLLGYVQEVSKPFAEDYDYLSPAGSSLRMLRWAMSKFVSTRGKLPCHKVTCIAERGLKTRTVTVGEAHYQLVGHCVRKRLLSGLRSTPGTLAPLSGWEGQDIASYFEGAPSDVLVSTDLTRATDLLTFDALRAAINGLEESGRFSPLEVEILAKLNGPQELLYRSPQGPISITSSRGCLMGLPTSWCMLSLIHLFWIKESTRHGSSERLHHTPRFSICGDDALLATTRSRAELYKKIVVEFGGSASKGKHFESSTGSIRRGVYLEKLYEFTVGEKGLTSGHVCDVMPLKSVTSTDLPSEYSNGCRTLCSPAMSEIVNLDGLGPHCADAAGNYIRQRKGLQTYAENMLGLVPGQSLTQGGFRWAKPGRTFASAQARVLRARVCRDWGFNLTSLVKELDPDYRRAQALGLIDYQKFRDKGAIMGTEGWLPNVCECIQGPVWRGHRRIKCKTQLGFSSFSGFSEDSGWRAGECPISLIHVSLKDFMQRLTQNHFEKIVLENSYSQARKLRLQPHLIKRKLLALDKKGPRLDESVPPVTMCPVLRRYISVNDARDRVAVPVFLPRHDYLESFSSSYMGEI